MSQEKTVVVQRGVGFCGLLFIVLLCLKVGVVPTQVVGWSWWWITAPLWGPPSIIAAMVAVVMLGFALFALLALAFGAIASIVKSK
jgi:hypothetical protein